MKKVCVLLADGFEEIEGLTVVDLLRRAKIYVDTISIMDDYIVHGAHGINVQTEDLFDEVDFDDYIGLFITGGRSPEYIRMDHKVISLVKCFVRSGKPVAAICHAAQVLTAADVVCGRKLTCYPALAAEVKLAGGNYIEVAPDEAVVDCNLITSPAWPGNTAILREFAKALGCEFIFRP